MGGVRLKTYALSIWVTNQCNLRCRYCFYYDRQLWNQTPSYMSEKTANKVVQFINSGKVESLSFFGAEPLLNWKIIKRILTRSCLPYISKKKHVYYITTNGTLLNKAILEHLEIFGVCINLSLDGSKQTHDYWRDNSYNAIIKNIDLLIDYPNIEVLKTLVDPSTLYNDIKHIKELGFKHVYINLLDPYSHITYKGYSPEEFKEQYKRVIQDFHGNNFSIDDFEKWKWLLNRKNPKPGCGFVYRGLAISPDGKFYPCHEAPSIPEFCIGDVWNGIDPTKEQQIRGMVEQPQMCVECPYALNKCPVSMYNKHKRFRVPPPRWYQEFEVAKIQAICELTNQKMKVPNCMKCGNIYECMKETNSR